jgi:hypothetical protein
LKFKPHGEVHTLIGFPGPVEVVLLGGMIIRCLVAVDGHLVLDDMSRRVRDVLDSLSRMCMTSRVDMGGKQQI